MALSVYEQLVAATSELLGPASGRFIDRQIVSHLQIKPEDLTAKDVELLSHWIRLSIGMLSNDRKTLQAYNQALLKLSKGGEL